MRFVHEASNVIFHGPPGVGKTHLSVALAEAAIRAGFGAYFMTGLMIWSMIWGVHIAKAAWTDA